MSLLGVFSTEPWPKSRSLWTVHCVASLEAKRQTVTKAMGVEADAGAEVTSLSVDCNDDHGLFVCLSRLYTIDNTFSSTNSYRGLDLRHVPCILSLVSFVYCRYTYQHFHVYCFK